MWYLQIDTLCIMLGFSVLFVLAGQLLRKWKRSARLMPFLVIFDLALIAYVSEKLAAFYLAYTAGSYLLIWLLRRAERGRRPLFVLFCLLDTAPFFFVRLAPVSTGSLFYITLIGFAYNMLKAVDGLFFVYYTKQEIRPLAYANFLLFFPVVTAGPIFRYRDFIKYYDRPQPLTAAVCEKCVKRLILGLFKKMVLVFWAQALLNRALQMGQHFYVSFALTALSYAILFLDLSGYSDVAIAVGTFIGVPVPENFKNPLTAASFTQFWRKWHVTLSDWIREHIFVVVSGKRLNKYQSALIGLGTMVIMGLWYEFSPVTLVDGVYMGAFLAVENIFGWTTADRRHTNKAVYALRCLMVTFFFGINAMTYALSGAQMAQALGGFFKW